MNIALRGEPSERLTNFINILHTTDRVHNYYEVVVGLRGDILQYLEQDGITQSYIADILNVSSPKFSTMLEMLRAYEPLVSNEVTVVAQVSSRTIPYSI
jgi:hypothetical protein